MGRDGGRCGGFEGGGEEMGRFGEMECVVCRARRVGEWNLRGLKSKRKIWPSRAVLSLGKLILTFFQNNFMFVAGLHLRASKK